MKTHCKQMSPGKAWSDFPQNKNRRELTITLKCRGCLTQEPEMNSLFVMYEKNTTLAKMIEESISYVICEEERFSEYLCKKCTKIIVNFIKFKKTFQEATEYFENLRIEKTKVFSEEEVKDKFKGHLITIAFGNDQKKPESEHNSELNLDQCETEHSGNCDNFKEAVNKDEIISECQTSKQTKQISCKLCNERFNLKVQLQRHERTIHQKKIRKRLGKKQTLSKHSVEQSFKKSDIICVNSNSPFLDVSKDSITNKFCKVCKNVFPAEEFVLHFESHKTHICNSCGHRFIRKTDLNDHMETHLDVCKYVCQHCGKSFKVRTVLNKHKRIHTNPREEICDVCGQRFNTRDTLKTHYKLKHIKSKDFQCNLCGLAFTLKSTLEKHIERHNPDRKRKYSCDLCNVSYINKYNLSRHHVIKHTPFENKPTCDVCGKGYIKKIDLVKHLKKHHRQDLGKNMKDDKQLEDDLLHSNLLESDY